MATSSKSRSASIGNLRNAVHGRLNHINRRQPHDKYQAIPANAAPAICASPSISAALSPTWPTFDETNGELSFGKALSTHGQLVDGIQNTLDSAGVDVDDGYLFLHGSTIAINTLLERNGAKTALLITEGFRDIYEIGRVNRPDAYNLFFSKHEPLITRSLRYEVPERLLRRRQRAQARSTRRACANWRAN